MNQQNPLIPTADELKRKKLQQEAVSSTIDMKTPGNPTSTSNSSPASGIAAPPYVEDIGGIPHQRIENKPYPGPLSMAASGIAGTVGYIASAPFNRDARAEQNRAGLDATAEIAAEKKRVEATNPAISKQPVIASPPEPIVNPGRDANGVITADSAKSAAGADMKRSGGIFGTVDMAGQNDRLAKSLGYANADDFNRAQANKVPAGPGILGGGSLGSLPGGQSIEDYNAEKTRQWRQDDMLREARNGNQVAVGSALHANGQTEATAMQTAATTENAKTAGNIAMRGQDMQAQNEAMRMAGTPADNALKSAQASGILAQSESTKLMAELERKALAGDKQAAATLMAIRGKNGESQFRTNVVGGGTNEIGQVLPQYLAITGPDGQTRFVSPNGGGAQQQAQAPKFEVGKTYTDAKGNKAIYQADGTWKEVA